MAAGYLIQCRARSEKIEDREVFICSDKIAPSSSRQYRRMFIGYWTACLNEGCEGETGGSNKYTNDK